MHESLRIDLLYAYFVVIFYLINVQHSRTAADQDHRLILTDMDVFYPRTEAFIKLYTACVFINDSKLVGDISVCYEVMPEKDYLGLLSLNTVECFRYGLLEIELDVSGESCW